MCVKGEKREVCMHKQSIHGGKGIVNWNCIAVSVKGEKRKEIVSNKETFDKEGSRIHQFRSDMSSSNKVLTIGSMLNYSSRGIS